MKVSRKRAAWAVLLLVLCGVASAQTFTCKQPDGHTTSYQQLPCEQPLADAPPAAPSSAASSPAVPEARIVLPTTPPPLTRRRREVIELTAILQRCRQDEPGFAERSDAVLAAWKQRHAETLAFYGSQVQAKVREARRHAAGLELCTDEWLQNLESLAQPPDPRFKTVERTWTLFVDALKAGDRETAVHCLMGKAEQRWRERLESLPVEDLRRIGNGIRGFRVEWGDDYLQEALAAAGDNQVSSVTFENRNEEWKISDL